jgi:hypothetical protein
LLLTVKGMKWSTTSWRNRRELATKTPRETARHSQLLKADMVVDVRVDGGRDGTETSTGGALENEAHRCKVGDDDTDVSDILEVMVTARSSAWTQRGRSARRGSKGTRADEGAVQNLDTLLAATSSDGNRSVW